MGMGTRRICGYGCECCGSTMGGSELRDSHGDGFCYGRNPVGMFGKLAVKNFGVLTLFGDTTLFALFVVMFI